jgi:hypothetical protein
VATISSLVSRVRLELGDQGKSFVTQFTADGTTNRFRLNYSPLDANCVYVYQDGENVTATSYVEESTGVLVVDGLPADGTQFNVQGEYYRYFTNNDLVNLVTQAVAQHSAGHTDSGGRQVTLENLPLIEEYPVVIYATTLALYTLATDASFDIDIAAPDGVNIPRSERYRQLMDMVQARQQQYKDLCVLLGVGMYKIDTFTLRRISKATGRYVPVYKPQEVDDRSYPQRVADQFPTYGDKQPVWPTDAGELIAYQSRAFTTTLSFTGNYDLSCTFAARLLNQRGSVLVVQNFGLEVVDLNSFSITAVLRTSGSTTATITATGNNFAVGDSISVIGVNTEFNKTWVVAAVIDANNFTVTTTATTPLALTSLTTATAILNGERSYTATLTLTPDQTLALAGRTYWSLQLVDPNHTDPNTGTILPDEIMGGNFFTERISSVVL